MKTSFDFPDSMARAAMPDSIEDFCLACVPVGSRVTCNPPPIGTDQDILCLVDGEELDTFYQWIESHQWEYEGDEKYTLAEFASYRKEFPDIGEINLIITSAPNWFDAFMDATRECKEKNVLDKAGRIAVFEKYIPQKKKKSTSKILEEITAQQQYNAIANMQANMHAQNVATQSQAQGNQAYNPQIHDSFYNNYIVPSSAPPATQQSLWGTIGNIMYFDDISETP